MSWLQKTSDSLQSTFQPAPADAALAEVKSQPAGQLQKNNQAPFTKPLLHILGPGEQPEDLLKKPKRMALRGQADVYITRAELELKKAMQSLTLMTHAEINSITNLTALSLPKSATSLFWTIKTFLQGKYDKPDDLSHIHHRNCDARLLFQHLVRLNLESWSKYVVDYISADSLPEDILFTVGHPVPGRTYRRHPFKSRRNQYYPTTEFFSMLLEERERSLLALLGELGATKITLTPIPNFEDLDCKASLAAQLNQQVFEYPPSNQPLPKSIDWQRHPWLAGEATWQSVVRERLQKGALSAQFNIDSDVMGMLKS